MQRSLVATLAWSSIALATACGGKVIFEQSSGAGGANVATTGSALGQQNSAVGTTSSGIGTGPATASVGTTGPATTSVGVTTGASTGSGALPPVWCNGQPCNTNEICCFNPNGPGDHCAQSGQCMPPSVELQCSSPADCPGGFCCAHLSPMGQYQGIACAQSCSGPGDHIICTKDPGVCQPGTSCHQSMQLGNGYRICF